MKKRILSFVLSVSLMLSLLPISSLAAGSMPFTDVTEKDWFFDAVEYVYENGMMSGTGNNKFSPNTTTTRGMIVTILHRMEGTPTAAGAAFSDVPEGQWYTAAVAWASANSIVNGYGNDKFGPNDTITREQMAAILYRYVQYKGYDDAINGDISSFADGSKVSKFAVDAMNWAIGAGLISGVGNNTLAPTGSATRAQVATILMRFSKKVVISTPVIDKGDINALYEYITHDLGEIEKKYLDSKGFVPYDKVSSLLIEVAEYAKEQFDNNLITDYSYTDGDSAVYFELDGWLGYAYSPYIEDSLAGGELVNVITFEPYHTGDWATSLGYVFSGLQGADEAAQKITSNLPQYSCFSGNYDDSNVLLSWCDNIKPNSIVIWYGHGCYLSQYGSILGLRKLHDYDPRGYLNLNGYFGNGHLESLAREKSIILVDNTICITPIYFENHVTKDALDGCLIYLAACFSFKDNRLAESLINRGARCVLGYTKDVQVLYNNKMLNSFFDAFSSVNENGSFRNISESVSYARDKHGEYDLRGASLNGLMVDNFTFLDMLKANNTIENTHRYISGRVIDNDTGMPLDGVTVSLDCIFGEAGTDLSDVATTASDGTFKLAIPENAIAVTSVQFAKEGYNNYSHLLPLVASVNNSLDIGSVRLNPIIAESTPNPTITGIVVDKDTLQPIAGATVRYGSEMYPNEVETVTTDSAGRFTFTGKTVADDWWFLSVAGTDDYSYRRSDNATAEGENTTAGFCGYLYVVKNDCMIDGMVRDEDGNLIMDASVYISDSDIHFSRSTDAAGLFYCWVPPGEYTVSVSKAGYISYKTTITVSSDDTKGLDVTLNKK